MHFRKNEHSVPDMQPESAFKRHMDECFKKQFDSAWRYHTSIVQGRGQKAGLPDRFYAALGKHCWVESKVEPYELSPLQEAVLPRLSRSGARVVVATLRKGDTISCLEYDEEGCKGMPKIWSKEMLKTFPFWNFILQKSSMIAGTF